MIIFLVVEVALHDRNRFEFFFSPLSRPEICMCSLETVKYINAWKSIMSILASVQAEPLKKRLGQNRNACFQSYPIFWSEA